jgi:hypothetical protein
MIPAPDLLTEYILGIFGVLIMASWIGIGLWKYVDTTFGSILTFGGMALGFTFIFLGINGAVGLGDWTDGKVDHWRDQITEEILSTECENLKQLSRDYKDSNIDKYTVGQIEDEIREEFVYKCIDTRDKWWAVG